MVSFLEKPAPLRGSEAEQIRQLHEYLSRLVDQLSRLNTVEEILNQDCGTEVPLKEQFAAIKNILGGGQND